MMEATKNGVKYEYDSNKVRVTDWQGSVSGRPIKRGDGTAVLLKPSKLYPDAIDESELYGFHIEADVVEELGI